MSSTNSTRSQRDLSARAVGMACPNGRWKPGLYHFLTRAKEPKRGLEASASLDWTNTRRC